MALCNFPIIWEFARTMRIIAAFGYSYCYFISFMLYLSMLASGICFNYHVCCYRIKLEGTSCKALTLGCPHFLWYGLFCFLKFNGMLSLFGVFLWWWFTIMVWWQHFIPYTTRMVLQSFKFCNVDPCWKFKFCQWFQSGTEQPEDIYDSAFVL